ncbi:MAG: transcription termination/antitermination protein NusG [Kiritimatiellia bacterium]
MKMEWFVLHCLVGQEGKVKRSIEARIKQEEMQGYIGKCLIPEEKVAETKNGKKRIVKKKIFPGWVMIEMALYEDGGAIDKTTGKRVVVNKTWDFLRMTPGIIGSWLLQRPLPLQQSEVDAILSNRPVAQVEKPRPKITIIPGETVKINDGAFMGLTGVVSVVDPDKGKLKVEVNVFSRKVPVDVEYWQIEKVEQEDLSDLSPAN